jgi:hypothetical protein
VDANEQPFILEAALFCSFSPLSVIPAMAQHAGREDLKHPKLFESFIERAAAEKDAQRKGQAIALQSAPVSLMATASTKDTLEDLGRSSSDDLSSSDGDSEGI